LNLDMMPTIDNKRIAITLERSGFTLSQPTPRVTWFGDNRDLACELAQLVRDGVKKASAGLLWMWELEGEPLPQPGEKQIVVDWDGEPLAVIEITTVRVRPFGDVDDAFAREEGEGDRTLGWWRAAHTEYFGRECGRLGKQLTDETPVVCWSFRLVHAVRAA
jgi:uncharacterized protein YhfF